MYIILLTVIKIIYTVAEVYNEPKLDQSITNSSQHVWHSYTFSTGTGNREELFFSNVELNHNFQSATGIFVWKSLQIQEEIVVFGLANNFLMISSLNKEYNSFTNKEEFQGSAKALAVFQKWNAKTQGIDNFLIVAICTSEESYTLKWYQLFNNKLKFLWDWPFYGIIIHLDIIKINYENKLLVVNFQGSVHNTSSAEIYNFNINSDLEVWLFEKIILEAVPSSVTIFDNNDNIFFSASFPSLGYIHVFKYSKSLCLDTLEKKHFVLHQKMFRIGLKSIISFRVGFRWYLAVASKISHIYYLGENLLFEPVSNLKLGSLNNWLAIPVDTYREDILLLADSSSDVSVITWTGDEHLEVIGSFTQFSCGNDTNCLEKMKKVALNESTAFTYNGYQNIIISTTNGSPLFFMLLIKLKPLPDKVALKLKDILTTKNDLEKEYNDQNEHIYQLLFDKEGINEIKSTNLSTEIFEAKGDPETVSQTLNQSEIKSDVDNLKTTVKSLNREIKQFLSDLKLGVPVHGGQNSNDFLKRNITGGIIFYGDILINELNLSTINGHDVNELLTDSFRKNKINKIGGKKTLKNVNAENVVFEKIGDTLACDIVFSDDPWEEKHRNIINGDIIWKRKLNVLNDVMIMPEAQKGRVSSTKIPRETSKHVYDALNMEELEVTEETFVQKTINGQPFILPVHSGQLNILDIVNQARVEVVNVKHNLDIGFINGRNFSNLLEQLLFKPPIQRQFDTLKVEGVFSAPFFDTDQLNNIDLSKGATEFDDNLLGKKLLENYRSDSIMENNLKKAKNQHSKRVIHVFQNLEIDGILFSNKINNISWAVLNDTIKRSESQVILTGSKKFDELFTSKKINLSGTLNSRFADRLLTNFSNQIIRFPQTFSNVKLKNVTLKGAWDGVFVDQLNRSVVRLSSNNGQTSDLTFEDECYADVLNITDFVNDISLDDKNVYRKLSNNKTELKSLKASSVILHGSLITNNKINNMNLSNFSLLRVSLKSPETIEKDLFHDNITMSGDISLETLNLNDVSSIMNSGGDTKLIEKFLHGEIHRIKKLLVKGNITTQRGINGFNLSEIFEKGVCITKPSSLKGNITFENTIYFDNINVTDSIDGFSLKQLEKDIVFKRSHVFLSGPKNFSNIKVTKNMKARSLNGHLVQNIVSLKGDQTIKGPIQINGDVIVKGNMTTYSLINNITIPHLLRTFSTKINSFLYLGDLNLRNDHVTIKNLVVKGNIQNVSLESFIYDILSKEGSFNVSGKKTFKGEVKLKANISVENFIHGVNFSKFYSDVAFINKPTKLEGTLIIQELALKVLEATGYFNSTLVNNFDTNDWLENSIPLDRYEVVDGKKVFEEAYALQDVSVDFINGHLPSSMISLKKKQYIPSLALFSRIHTTSDLSVLGSVNGKNLIKEYQDTILINGGQTIKGNTLFDKEFTIKGTLFLDTIKGKSVNSLITLDTEQIIKTPLEFKGLVTAKKDVQNLKVINNINLQEWNQNSVSLNQQQVLNGSWTVKGKVKTTNVDGEGLLHAACLSNVSKDVQKSRLMALETKNATKIEFSDQCHKVKNLSKQFSELPYLFYQFEIADEIETLSVIDSVITFKINNDDHLIITFLNECLSTLYKWNKDSGAFDYIKQVNIGTVKVWSVMYGNKGTYLVTSSSKSNINCEKNLQQGNIWLFKNDLNKYAHLLSTNAFTDITHENNTSGEFFTIDESGVLQQWIIEENGNINSKFLLSVGPGNYRFIDFQVMGGLAISNGKEVKQISLTEDKVIENNIAVANAYIVPLPVEKKTLIAVVVNDRIVVYENILEGKIFSLIQTSRAGSVLWFNYGSGKQAFLIVASHHKLIEVYEYKSVAGLVKKMSIPMFSSRLQSETLPAREKYRSNKYIIVIQKKKLIFVRADMLGDFIKNDLFC